MSAEILATRLDEKRMPRAAACVREFARTRDGAEARPDTLLEDLVAGWSRGDQWVPSDPLYKASLLRGICDVIESELRSSRNAS